MSPRVTQVAGWNPTLPMPGNFQKPELGFGFGFEFDILLSIYYEPDMFQTLSH